MFAIFMRRKVSEPSIDTVVDSIVKGIAQTLGVECDPEDTRQVIEIVARGAQIGYAGVQDHLSHLQYAKESREFALLTRASTSPGIDILYAEMKKTKLSAKPQEIASEIYGRTFPQTVLQA